MNNTKFDIIIIGSGPGGYVTAIRSAQLGFKTAVVEKNQLGGICLNWGCIPTKSILRSAEIFHYIKNAENYGLSVSNVQFDIKKIIKRSRVISKNLSDGVSYLLKKNGVTVIDGSAQIRLDKRIEITKKDNTKTTISGDHIIIAAGARPTSFPGIEVDGKQIWTHFDALQPDHFPQSIIIIGAGAIGIEFASFYNSLGAEVTIIEMKENILPNEDKEISELARKQFEVDGIKFFTSAKLESVIKGIEKVTCQIKQEDGNKKELTSQKVLLATGINGNIEYLGIENTKIKTKFGHILTDEFSRTGEPNFYAIGDIAGPPWLAHKAEREGIICVEKIAGQTPSPINKMRIPACTYCYPQIASVGLTEGLAKEKKIKIKIGRFPLIGNGKGMAMGEETGMIKTIFSENTGELLGAHMIGPEVTELIQGCAIAIGLETTEAELINTIFPHPTLSEMFHESVLNAYDQGIHM